MTKKNQKLATSLNIHSQEMFKHLEDLEFLMHINCPMLDGSPIHVATLKLINKIRYEENK